MSMIRQNKVVLKSMLEVECHGFMFHKNVEGFIQHLKSMLLCTVGSFNIKLSCEWHCDAVKLWQ